MTKKRHRLYVECEKNEGWESNITVGLEYRVIGGEFDDNTRKAILYEIIDDNKNHTHIPALYFSEMRRQEHTEVTEDAPDGQLSLMESIEMVMVLGQVVDHLQKNLLTTIGCRTEWKEDIRKVRFAHTAQKNNLLKFISVSRIGRNSAEAIGKQLSSEKIQDIVSMFWYANKFKNVGEISEALQEMYFEARKNQTPIE